MKKWIVLFLAAALVLTLAACKKTEAPTAAEENETAADGATETTAGDATGEKESGTTDAVEAETEPVKYELVTYGRISAAAAPEGWEISEDSADWRIVYVKPDADGNKYAFSVPTIQLTTDESDAEALFKSVTSLREENDEAYTSEELSIAGIPFRTMVPALGTPAMYGTVDGQTLVVTFSKDVDLQDPAVAYILGSVRIAAE